MPAVQVYVSHEKDFTHLVEKAIHSHDSHQRKPIALQVAIESLVEEGARPRQQNCDLRRELSE